jgi:hypothetical protein
MSDPAEQEEGLSPRCFPTRSCCAYAWQAVPCTSCGKIIGPALSVERKWRSHEPGLVLHPAPRYQKCMTSADA